MPAEHSDKQRYDAFHDEGITFCGECNYTVGIVSLQPHTALASVYEVAFGLVFVVQRRLVVAHVYEHLIFVHPVVKLRKLLYYLVLYFVYCHHSFYLFFISCSCLLHTRSLSCRGQMGIDHQGACL